MQYEDLNFQAQNNTDRSVTQAVLMLFVNGTSRGEMRPSLDYYPASDQVWTRVASRTSLAGDVYVSLLAVESDGKTISVRLESHPIIVWLWIGGAIRRPRQPPRVVVGPRAATRSAGSGRGRVGRALTARPP